jgi:amino acid transporter
LPEKTPGGEIGFDAGENPPPVPPRRELAPQRTLALIPLVALMYLVVSGGAYGLEDAVRLAGPRSTLLLCAVVPLTLSLPTALMAAELTALMPVEGGFYFWVKEAFGPFAGFMEAYFTLLYTAVDMAIYPVLFVAYLSFILPIGFAGEAILALALVWLSGLLNLLGIRPVGNASTLLTVVLLAPFGALVLCGLPRLIQGQVPGAQHAAPHLLSALGAGLTVVIWNFCGWENLSVVAAEIENPRRNYLRAIGVALPLVALGYILPLKVAVSGPGTISNWETGSFALVGTALGGRWLGLAIAIGGGVSAFAIFEAGMLWVSRMPVVLAREQYLPRALSDLNDRTAMPWKSILACCGVYTLLLPMGFVALVVMDVFFYMSALTLELGALLKLRRLQPERAGLFTIGGGRAGLYLTALAPMLTWLATFGLAFEAETGAAGFAAAVGLAMLGWPIHALLKRRYGGPA